jgi:hypothetical protein
MSGQRQLPRALQKGVYPRRLLGAVGRSVDFTVRLAQA